MTLCAGCLSIDRTLSSLSADDLELLKTLVKSGRRSKGLILQNDLSLCWECCNCIKKITLFRKRVLASQTIQKCFSSNVDVDVIKFESLSSLETVTKIEYDLSISHSSDDFKTEIKIENSNDVDGDNDFFNADHFNDSVGDDFDDGIKEEDIANEANDSKSSVKDIPHLDKVEETKLKEVVVKLEHLVHPDVSKSIEKHETKLEDCRNELGSKVAVIPIDTKVKKSKRKLKTQYKLIELNQSSENWNKHIEEIKIGFHQAKDIFNQQLKSFKAKCLKSKISGICEYCLLKFKFSRTYLKHMKTHGSVDGNSFYCDICNRGFKSRLGLIPHIKSHVTAYRCKLCGDIFPVRHRLMTHLLRHSAMFQCTKCPLTFEWVKDFHIHYKDIHASHICDYCGVVKRTKEYLARHIKRNHMDFYCKECDARYLTHRSLYYHKILKHTKAESEETYCVECNIQFSNIQTFQRHLRSFVRHTGSRKGEVPCPICKKVYTNKKTMNYHYRYHHLKKTNFYCEPCQRYFLNPFRLREHKQTKHDKIPLPKNKFCDICGRGFSANSILANHRRTHTGERPFVCGYCPAAFAQKYAMYTHQKTQHKIYKDKPAAVPSAT